MKLLLPLEYQISKSISGTGTSNYFGCDQCHPAARKPNPNSRHNQGKSGWKSNFGEHGPGTRSKTQPRIQQMGIDQLHSKE
jgi:hypothetical protein